MQTQIIEYADGDVSCKAFFAFDESRSGPQPTVFVVHAFDGITEFIHDYAKKIVEAGYAAFCVDMFGEGKTATDVDGCMALIMPFLEDRALLQKRVLAGFNTCKSQDVVDENKVVAMGFCFGGMCALDLARSGADIKAVASLHGVLMPPEGVELGDFKAKVIILHGFEDPQVPPEQLPVITKELNEKNVDWQFIYFSHTQHSFTEPRAGDIGGAEMGRVFNPDSARRAWEYCQVLFKEVI
jgi:dienelactone hydrolase